MQTPSDQDARLLIYLSQHPYRKEIVAFIIQEAFRQGVAWRHTLLDVAYEIEMESKR
jgi:hypothetical protein